MIEATKVAEIILLKCTSDGERESCSIGSTARDRDSGFSSNHSGESGGHTPAFAESVPTNSGTEESSSSSSTPPRVKSVLQRLAHQEGQPMNCVGRFINLLPLVFGLEHGPQRGGRGTRQEMSRAMAGGASGPKAFTLLLRLLMTHFDGVDTEEGYTKLLTFGMCTGTPFSDFSREF